MNRAVAVLLISALFLGPSVAVKPVLGGATVVKVDPSLIEYHQDATGQQFSVAVEIIDVTNLYGFDVKLKWNTTFLAYNSHSIRVPRNTYSNGVLWDPTIPVMNEVNTTAGTYWIAYTSRWPAPSFNGSGTIFTITFQVVYHPVQPQPDANITLELYSTDLSNMNADPIPHAREHGRVILYALAAAHDIAVTNVAPLKKIVGQGYNIDINSSIQNQGNYEETFTVTLYANATPAASRPVTLASGNSITITFVWNTTGFVKGNYTISAVADTVPDETDTADNALTDGAVYVGIPGDIVSQYGKVDIKDVYKVGQNYGKVKPPGSPPWDPEWGPLCDINNDGKIDMKDYYTVCKNYGKVDP